MRLTEVDLLGFKLEHNDDGLFWGRIDTTRSFGEANSSKRMIVVTYPYIKGMQNHALEVINASHSEDGNRTHFEVRSLQ